MRFEHRSARGKLQQIRDGRDWTSISGRSIRSPFLLFAVCPAGNFSSGVDEKPTMLLYYAGVDFVTQIRILREVFVANDNGKIRGRLSINKDIIHRRDMNGRQTGTPSEA